MTSSIRLYTLGDFQSDRQIASLVDFSNEHWPYGGWEAAAFRETDGFAYKLELSCVLADVKDNVLGVFIASQQRERYLKSAIDDYLYIHKILIDPLYRGHKVDGRSLFGTMWHFSLEQVEVYDLYSQLLTVDEDNLKAIGIYKKCGFCYMGDRSYGKILMGRGFPDLSTESYFEI